MPSSKSFYVSDWKWESKTVFENAQNDQIDDIGAGLWGDVIINGFLTFDKGRTFVI